MLSISINRTAGIGKSKGSSALARGKQTGAEATDKSGNAVCMEDAEGVVNLAEVRNFLAHDVHAEPRDSATGKANDDGAPTRHDTGSRSDGDESRDHPLDGANNGRLLVVDYIAHGPAEQRHGGGDVGIENGGARIGGGRIWISTIEAVPAQPEKARADQDGDIIAWATILAILLQSGPDPMRGYESGGAGGDVNDIATGVVDDAHLEEKPASPYRVGANGVAEGDPERDENHPGGEVHAAEDGAGQDDDGDGGEDELEIDHCGEGEVLEQDGRCGWELRLAELLRHGHDRAGPANEWQHVDAEAHLVRPEDPGDQRGSKAVEGHEGAVYGPFITHETRISGLRG